MSSVSQELSGLGVLFQVLESAVILPNGQAAIQLLPSNPLRWYFAACCPGTPSSALFIVTNPDSLANNVGIPLASSGGVPGAVQQTVERWFRRHAQLCQLAWTVGTLGGVVLTADQPILVQQVLLVPG